MIGQEDKRTNNRTMLPTVKYNAAAGFQGRVKIEPLKGAGLLLGILVMTSLHFIYLHVRKLFFFTLISTSLSSKYNVVCNVHSFC